MVKEEWNFQAAGVGSKSSRSILIPSGVVKKRLTRQIKGVEVFEWTVFGHHFSPQGGTGAVGSGNPVDAKLLP